ncbi:MAG TPA: protein kinase [Thermoanaerobaculia bacterium]|nr:protein kinase [Thermoanaerobaculia bacterium]
MSGPSLIEGATVGRYRIRRLLGAGGMGEVYLAWDGALDRPVALKILPPHLMREPHRVERFITEAKAASALNHPAIVTIYETGEDSVRIDGEESSRVHYIAMELIEGTTLEEWVRLGQPLSSLLGQLASVAEGLGKAHARGIVHRDLKPDNIMITSDGHAKVLDFGIAKLLDGERQEEPRSPSDRRTLTEPSALLGTLGYMPPEQIEGFVLDHRADIFSFGCILYEALSGRAPFLGRSNAETLHNIVHRDPAPLGVADPRLDEALRRIVDRCIAKDRERRYDSARDLGLDLIDAMALAPAPRPKRIVRSKLRSRVMRAGVVISALALALLFLRVPAEALVDTVTAAVAPSKNPEVQRLERLLSLERERNLDASAALTEREREIARRGAEIEGLRTERDQSNRLRSDLEESYRTLLSDVEDHLRRNKSESSELRVKVANAETELQRVREEAQRRATEQERLGRVERELSRIVYTRTEPRGIVATIPGMFFRSGRSRMPAESHGMLQGIATLLTDYPELKIAIEGHSDSSGSADWNLELSRERAETIRGALIMMGIDPARITAIGRGELVPAFSNESEEGRTRNRRVEIILSH